MGRRRYVRQDWHTESGRGAVVALCLAAVLISLAVVGAVALVVAP